MMKMIIGRIRTIFSSLAWEVARMYQTATGRSHILEAAFIRDGVLDGLAQQGITKIEKSKLGESDYWVSHNPEGRYGYTLAQGLPMDFHLAVKRIEINGDGTAKVYTTDLARTIPVQDIATAVSIVSDIAREAIASDAKNYRERKARRESAAESWSREESH